MSKTGTHWTKGRLALYSLLLASVLVIVFGVVLTFLDGDLEGGEVASAIGLNLIASVLFALIFSGVNGRIQERLLLEQVDGAIGDVSQKLLGRLAGYEAHFMPVATYDAGNQWSRAYNNDVTASLDSTATYAFRGTSAKYVPPRLHRAPRGKLRHVRIIMLDPRDDRVLQARAAIKKDQTGSSETDADIAKALKDEILMSVVALFDCRRFCEPEIAFVRDVAATRIELFDDAVYVSWYQGPDSAKKPFPESLKFAEGTFPYAVQAQEFHGRFGLADYEMKIKRYTTESDIRQELEKLADRDVTQGDIEGWRERHAKHVEGFQKFIDQE